MVESLFGGSFVSLHRAWGYMHGLEVRVIGGCLVA